MLIFQYATKYQHMRLAVDPELLHPGPEGRAVEAKERGSTVGAREHAACLFKRLPNMPSFGLFERDHVVHERRGMCRQAEVIGLQDTPLAQDDGPFEDVRELAHIPGPVVAREPIDRARIEPAHPPAPAAGELPEETAPGGGGVVMA